MVARSGTWQQGGRTIYNNIKCIHGFLELASEGTSKSIFDLVTWISSTKEAIRAPNSGGYVLIPACIHS